MDIPNIRLVFHWQHPSSAEDYLQEFGRAGRDGKQSLAVLFTKYDDTEIPDFLLRKTLEKLPLSDDERQSLYKKKRASITLMSNMAEGTTSCLTQMLKDELDVDRTPKKTFARFILGMIFSRRQKISSRDYCCDGCYRKQKQAGKVSDFASEVIEGMR